MDENKDVPKNRWFNGIEWERWKVKKKINMFRNRKRRGKGKGIREKIKSFAIRMIKGL